MDEMAEAIEEFDDQREADRAWADRFGSRRETPADEDAPKGRQKGFKGGWMGTGQRTEEERVRAGRWRTHMDPVQDPTRGRLASEHQWELATQCQHRNLSNAAI